MLGADARKALARVPRVRDLVPLWVEYARRFTIGEVILFACLDLVRRHFYAKGFRDGATYPWRDRP